MPKPFEDNQSENVQLRANQERLRAVNQQLKAKEAELESLARFPSENPNPVLRISNDGTVIYHNDASGPLLAHWDCAEKGKLPELWQKVVKQTLEDEKPLESTVGCDGKSYSLSFVPVPASNYVNIYATDITARLQTQNALREKDAMLRKTSELGHMGGWEYYPKTGDVIWTEEVSRIYDMDPTGRIDVATALTYYTESSRLQIEAALDKLVNQGIPYNLEVEMITAKGNHKWVRTIGEAVLENGECVKVRGMIQDITSPKKIEQQFRAANQQLTASEQQLKASDHQLRASNEQLKDANQKLLDSEERFRLLMEQSPSVIEIYDRSGLQIAVNKAYEELWGFPAEHTVNRFNVLESHEIKRLGHLPYIQKAYAGESVTLPEYEYDATGETEGRGRGRKRRLYTRIYPIKNNDGKVENIVITHEDITERVEAQRKLREKEGILRKTARLGKIGGWEFNPETGEGTWTEEVARIHDLDPHAETNLKTGLGFYAGHSREIIETAVKEAIEQGKAYDVELELTTAKGAHKWVRSIGEPILKNGRCVKVRGMFQDITIQKQTEQKLRASNQQLQAGEQQLMASNQQLKANEIKLNNLMRTLESKNEELQSIVYVASHDLKSPLVNICGFGKLLSKHCRQLKDGLKENEIDDALSRIIDQEIPEDIDFILQSAEKMNALINGLLEVSRAGMMSLNIRHLEMNELIEGIIKNVRYKTRQLEAAITVDPLAPCVGDAAQISRVFTNLIENALKYADPSRKPRIHISGTVCGDHCVYCVEDNGIGIDSAYHGKIFEIFHRLNPQHVSDGEGLGLTIVRRILDRHSGTVWLESAVGKGSKFFVSLSNKEAL